jgi:hypothetical protein
MAKRALHGRLVRMVATCFPGMRVHGQARGRKDILPAPVPAGIRVFALECVRQVDLTVADCQVASMQVTKAHEMLPQGRHQRRRQNAHPILESLPLAHRDLAPQKTHVLHPQPEAFEDAYSGPVQQPQKQSGSAQRALQQGLHFRRSEHP